MPSQIIHLAIAKRYLTKHPQAIRDVQAFLDGSVLPDLASDKAVSHCGVRTEKHDIVKRNAQKVSPTKFAATHDLSDDLNKGQYLHLYTDYQYYNVFLLDYFKQMRTSFKQISIDIYETSRRDDAYLRQKYGVEYTDTTIGQELQTLNDIWDQKMGEFRQRPDYHFSMPYSDTDALDVFIEQMADTEIPQS